MDVKDLGGLGGDMGGDFGGAGGFDASEFTPQAVGEVRPAAAPRAAAARARR